jgi:hypothetical protein
MNELVSGGANRLFGLDLTNETLNVSRAKLSANYKDERTNNASVIDCEAYQNQVPYLPEIFAFLKTREVLAIPLFMQISAKNA